MGQILNPRRATARMCKMLWTRPRQISLVLLGFMGACIFTLFLLAQQSGPHNVTMTLNQDIFLNFIRYATNPQTVQIWKCYRQLLIILSVEFALRSVSFLCFVKYYNSLRDDDHDTLNYRLDRRRKQPRDIPLSVIATRFMGGRSHDTSDLFFRLSINLDQGPSMKSIPSESHSCSNVYDSMTYNDSQQHLVQSANIYISFASLLART